MTMMETYTNELRSLGAADALRFMRAIDRSINELDISANGYGYQTTPEFMDLREELLAVQKKQYERLGGDRRFLKHTTFACKQYERNNTPFYKAYLALKKEHDQQRNSKLMQVFVGALELFEKSELLPFIKAEIEALSKKELTWHITEEGHFHCPACFSGPPQNKETGEYIPTRYCSYCGQKLIHD